MKIALIGLHGALGSSFLDAFTSQWFLDAIDGPIYAVTRTPDQEEKRQNVEYVAFDKLPDLVKSIDVLVSLVGPQAANDAILDALKTPGSAVKLYVPSEFGYEVDKVAEYLPKFLPWKAKHVTDARALGIKVLETAVGYFIVPGKYLYEWVGVAGLDAKKKTVQYIGKPESQLAVSAPKDIGLAIARVLAAGIDSAPEKLRFFSDLVSFKQLVEQWEERHKEHFERLPTIPTAQATVDAQKRLEDGLDFRLFSFYLQVIAANGRDRGVLFSNDDRETINPGEKYFKWASY